MRGRFWSGECSGNLSAWPWWQWEAPEVRGDHRSQLQLLAWSKRNICSVNQHCCFNHGTVSMVLGSVCCTCPVLFMLCIQNPLSICFAVDKFNIMCVVPENFKLWSFLGFLVYLLNIYWNGSWPGMREEEEMLFNNTGLTCYHKWCKALFTLSVL